MLGAGALTIRLRPLADVASISSMACCVFFVARHAVMPLHHVLHKADAFAFDGVGDYDCRAAIDWRIGQGRRELFKIVAVDTSDRPAERSEFVVDRRVVANVARWSGDLQRVVVDDCGQVVESVMRRAHRRFPV